MLINYLPKFLADIEEIKAIMDSCQGNIDNIEIELDNILKDLFVKDATLNGIERYENMLDILPKLTDSLEIRKANILLKYNQTLPFTLENLILMLNSVCGENNYTIKIIYEEFKINIRIN
ncbi:MAG: YmfQ family protein, partial [Eubacteriales bacterium]|nr:YmfQ family protein [Eubacteriales bacterium]